MYEISIDEDKSILRLKLAGHWTSDQMARFSNDLREKTAIMRERCPIYGVLSDSRDFLVQSQEVAAQFESLVNRNGSLRDGPIAIVVGTSMNRMQAERTMGKPNLKVFMEIEEAENWVVEELNRIRTG